MRVAVAILLAAFSAGAACSDSGTAEETAGRTQGFSQPEEAESGREARVDREAEEARPGEARPDTPAGMEGSSGDSSSAESAPAKERTTPAQPSSPDRVESEAESAFFSGFQARVQEYLGMREKLVNSLPPLPDSTSPERIAEHQKNLAALIQKNRAEAQQGHLFSDSSEQAIRERIQEVLNGVDGEENRALIFNEHHPDFQPKINQDYPEDAALSTMPPELLERLPEIPDVLEYRIVGNHLILYDIDADLILDFIPGVIQ